MLCQNTLFRFFFFSLIRRTDSFLSLINTTRIIYCLLYTSNSPSCRDISGANTSEAEEPCHCHVLGGDTAVPRAVGHRYGRGIKEPGPKADQLPGKEQLRAPGIPLLMSWFTVNPRDDDAESPQSWGWSCSGNINPESSSGHQQCPPWAGSQPEQAFFSTKQCFHLLHTGLQTPDISQSQTQPHNSISGFSPLDGSGRGKTPAVFPKGRC